MNASLARASSRPRPLALVIALAALAVWAMWLALTPSGLLGKADAVGYAVCHRIDARSFHIAGRQLPLCARCTGIYLGALLGLVTLALWRKRAGGLPPPPISGVLIGFVAVMGVDGANSYLTFFPGPPHLYEPQNWLRLTTGTLAGLALSAFVFPAFNQTVWKDWEERRSIESFGDLARLVGLAAILIALVLSENAAVLYPLALLSSLGVLVLLAAIFTILALIFLRRENTVGHPRELLWPALGGLTLGIVQIGVFDALRFALTHTWAGFAL